MKFLRGTNQQKLLRWIVSLVLICIVLPLLWQYFSPTLNSPVWKDSKSSGNSNVNYKGHLPASYDGNLPQSAEKPYTALPVEKGALTENSWPFINLEIDSAAVKEMGKMGIGRMYSPRFNDRVFRSRPGLEELSKADKAYLNELYYQNSKGGERKVSKDSLVNAWRYSTMRIKFNTAAHTDALINNFGFHNETAYSRFYLLVKYSKETEQIHRNGIRKYGLTWGVGVYAMIAINKLSVATEIELLPTIEELKTFVQREKLKVHYIPFGMDSPKMDLSISRIQSGDIFDKIDELPSIYRDPSTKITPCIISGRVLGKAGDLLFLNCQ